tara:strand:- start:43 stop:294 length:252 start_codon:yes stop_codon:yes gene_type:complete
VAFHFVGFITKEQHHGGIVAQRSFQFSNLENDTRYLPDDAPSIPPANASQGQAQAIDCLMERRGGEFRGVDVRNAFSMERPSA